jgi:cell division transport system permease protein
MWISMKRIARSGFFSFWRNGFVSLSSVLVMIITLFVITGTIFLGAILNASLEAIRDKVDINVYFSATTPEEIALSLKKDLETLPEVKGQVEYMSAEDVITEFRKQHQNDQSILDSLDVLPENPLGPRLNINAKDPSQYESIAQFIKTQDFTSQPGVSVSDNYSKNKEIISRLTNIINTANRLGFILTLFLVCVSILITFNTIRLAIFMSRDEISVMRLVGASRMYIRGPFIVSGAIYGVVSGFITLILFFPITLWLGNATAEFFVGLNVFSYYISNFAQIFLIVIFSGAFIGALSSFLAVRKHLKI